MKMVIVLYLGIIFSRLIPHPPNMTPIIAFAIFLSAERYGLLGVMLSFLISDQILGLVYHYPLYGTWSFFSYSAMILIILASKYLRSFSLIWGLSATVFYWIWTNLGVWILSGMYPLNFIGFSNCYILAIPFLINNLIGTIIGFIIIYALPYKINQPLKPVSY